MLLLNAINTMLRGVGESPVADENSTHPSVQMARATLEAVRIELLAEQWWFNKDFSVELVPEINDFIYIPLGTMQIEVLSNRYIVRRDDRLYNTLDNTYVFEAPIEVNLHPDIAFDDLPPLAQLYIMYRATADFIMEDDGDMAKQQSAAGRADSTLVKLNSEHLKQQRYNALDAPASARLRAGVHRPYGGGPSGDYIGGRNG